MPTRNPSSTTTLVQGEPRSRFFAGLLAASLLGLAAVLSGPPSAEAQTLQDVGQARQDAVVRSATTVLNEIMGIPLAGIPTSMLADAHAVAIIPNVLKGGFVIGARYGRGVLLVRDEAGL